MPDLAAGAMENWGLVTFKETTLLVSGARGAGGGAPGLSLANALP